jgi:hypothetical protein
MLSTPPDPPLRITCLQAFCKFRMSNICSGMYCKKYAFPISLLLIAFLCYTPHNLYFLLLAYPLLHKYYYYFPYLTHRNKFPVRLIILPFSPSDVDLRPTITLADFCKYQGVSLLHFIHCCFFGILAYLRQLIYRSIKVSLFPFYSRNPFIYAPKFGAVLDFCFYVSIIHLNPTVIKFLLVGSSICRQLLSDSQSPPDTFATG